MKTCFYLLLASVVLLPTQSTRGQTIGHADVDFRYHDGKIEIQPQATGLVIPQVFPDMGFFRQANSNPGFFSERDVGGGVGSEDIIIYNVLDDLFFWSEGEFAELQADTQIRIQNNPSFTPETVIGVGTGVQRGATSPLVNSIGQASADGDFHSHVDFQLEPISSNPREAPPFGAYGLKLSLSTDNPDVEESDPFFLVYRFGIDEEMFRRALDDFDTLLLEPSLAGDFDADGVLTVMDIDLLSAEVVLGNHPNAFDLNRDDLVDEVDRSIWVEQLAGSLFGDADLNRSVEFADFLALSSAFGQSGGWGRGDFDGNGAVQFGDFLLLSANFGQTAASPAVVPEPVSGYLALMACALLLAGVRLRPTARGRHHCDFPSPTKRRARCHR